MYIYFLHIYLQIYIYICLLGGVDGKLVVRATRHIQISGLRSHIKMQSYKDI